MSVLGQPWLVAITKPSINTYQSLANDPKANAWRPTIWILLAGFIAAILEIGADYLTNRFTYQAFSSNQLAQLIGPRLLFGVIGSLGGFILFVGVQHLIAQRLEGNGTFGQQAYVVGAIIAPLLILSVVVASLPIINVIVLPLVVFGLTIDILALKAVYDFGWIKALLSSFALWFLIAVLLLAVFLYLIGPQVGIIFSNMMKDNL